MTRAQRRSKSQLVNRWRKLGYSLRRGRIWERWRFRDAMGRRLLNPIFHADYELGVNERDWEG